MKFYLLRKEPVRTILLFKEMTEAKHCKQGGACHEITSAR